MGGDWNASIKQCNAPHRTGRWASQKESTNSGNDQFHAGTKDGGSQHFPANPMAQQIHMVEGPLKDNDRLLPMPRKHATMALLRKKQMLQVEHAKRPQNDKTQTAGRRTLIHH